MRLRSAALLSTAAVAALVLAGCSADDDQADPAPGSDLCAAAGASGDAVESIDIAGTAADGVPDTLELGDGAEIEEYERTLVTEGTGEEVAEGAWVSYAIAGYDAATGEQVGTNGYNAGDALPEQMTVGGPLAPVLGCAPVGSRIATVYPAFTDEMGTEYSAQIQIVDVLGTVPTAAWGSDQEPEEGAPVVTLAEDGEPSIELPDGFEAGETTEVVPLKVGDGIEVREGDQVLVQYAGYKGSDGSQFDASWPTPISFNTTGVVEGFATTLVGQTVGSQVIGVIPREEGYGTEGSEGHELFEEDLVFVVDILGTRHDGAAAAE